MTTSPQKSLHITTITTNISHMTMSVLLSPSSKYSTSPTKTKSTMTRTITIPLQNIAKNGTISSSSYPNNNRGDIYENTRYFYILFYTCTAFPLNSSTIKKEDNGFITFTIKKSQNNLITHDYCKQIIYDDIINKTHKHPQFDTFIHFNLTTIAPDVYKNIQDRLIDPWQYFIVEKISTPQ